MCPLADDAVRRARGGRRKFTVQEATHAVVTLLASVNGQLMQLGVPIYAANGPRPDTVAPGARNRFSVALSPLT